MALNGYKVFVDPGHGGKDPGAVGGGYTEAAIVLDIGKFLKTELEKLGATVQMSRSTDTYPENPDRSIASNNFGADIYVSLHINAGGGTGIETWIHDNASSYTTSLANAVNNSLVAALGKTNRGVKKAPSQRGGTNIHVIDPKNTKAWAILPEMLFIDTASDRNTLVANKQTCARAIANGINSFAMTLPPI
ncbi:MULTISPECIES: N-acetylmuramoyl-L-alanine amidase [unclassified Paenibacillus]|uniref:N-acetylmuramoyl-L-alanine amidase n=1 Tax=unclassified Paenibacillus TaxID=185978 RepID=UPI000405FA8F|nr:MULTISPECIES: N-acetylmuramoyl-L-alanine amidase [unclassified Paenibacillus]KGP77671.1 cell wall hydrolase [Paenibacillus sp. MAEPY2]KGP78710.1 cell wall hydrolase [Paenibacillus sp. MAEPY1]